MALQDHIASFSSVLPALRFREDILADLAASASGRATDANRAAVAQIELDIQDADNLYRQRQYTAALNKFKQARASIFKILYPDFDVHSYLTGKDLALPVSATLVSSIINASVGIADAIRPLSVQAGPVFRRDSPEPIPQTLQPYTATGFRESVNIDELMQVASGQGVALLQDQKPEAAAALMQDALNRATAPGIQADPALRAALELNLSAAYIPLGDAQKATALANGALERFKASEDLVGQAQALHIAGVAAQQAGNVAGARQLLQQASDVLKQVGAQPGAPPTPVGLPATIGITAAGAAAAPALLSATTSAQPRLAMRLAPTLSKDVTALQPIATMNSQAITFRIAGRENGWGVLPLPSQLEKREQAKTWQVGIPAGENLVSFKVGGGVAPNSAEVINNLYQARISATRLADLTFHIVDTSTTTFYLTHLYAYVLPVKIGDCYHQLGLFAKAEEYYLQAATYTFLNTQIEATDLWIRLGRNVLEWGDSLYKNEDFAGAKTQYSKLITDAGAAPNSFLYATASLSVPATAAKTLIQNLNTDPLPVINADISTLVLTAFSRLQQLQQNLDFYGLLLSPIHTFEYLQNVARGFAQEAIQAEREFVNFKNHQELEEATRRDLVTAQAMAHAEVDARFDQYQSAQDDERAAQKAHELATKRRDDAVTQKNAYQVQSSAQIWAQAAAQAQGMGQDSWYNEISDLADKLARGESISGPRGKLAAAYTLYAGRKTQAYELQKMQDNIDELNKAIGIALDQLNAAKGRTAAARTAWLAAIQRASLADAALTAFDNAFFTPETWSKMADVMRDISRSYLYRGIRIAKLMERAYNFDNDTQLKIIKNDYGHNVAAPAAGRDTQLLGGDSLLQDIESFTYYAITSKTRKNSRIKDVISISSTFPAQFEEFRRTGLLSIETDLYEFDRLHPGFYGQRIEAIELEIIGLLPETGLNGSLTGGGVTAFRKRDGSAGKRVHQVDTMALSSFSLRSDVFLYSTETGVRGLFQGIGLGSTFQLHLPKRGNDFDFRRIFDVNLIFYYNAMFDEALRTKVLAAPPRPGELTLLRNYGLRYDFPDAWYGFYQAGLTKFNFDRVKLPINQQNFKISAVHFRVVTKPGIANAGIDVHVTGPNAGSGTVTTDSDGLVSTTNPALAGLLGAVPFGDWQIQITGGAPLTDAGTLKFDRVYNIQMGLEYSFDFVPEVI